MSEVANQPPKPKDASSTKDTQAHPVREWIDTLLKAAVIAKGDQKTGTQPQTEDTSPSATAATETTATSVPTSNSSKDDDAENKPEKTVDGSKETAPPPPSEGLEDGAVDTGRDATEASTTVAKRYRRRRCEVEGCNKFARFNNACSGHVVDIACKERSSDSYCGADKERQSVELKFGDFVDYYQASFTKQTHWLQTVDDLEFYLCQCPIAVFKPDATCAKATLSSIMDEFCLPKCLQDKPMTQVNLWMTVRPSRTTLHYDAYQNVLVVLYGKKTVTLYPPSDSANLYPFPVHSKSANHSQVNIVQPNLSEHPRFSKASAQRFTIAAGDALLIPEGWWHQVDSDAFTIAVNYWWDDVREQLVADSRLVPYYARVLMEELIKQQCEASLLALRSTGILPQEATFMDESSAVSAFLTAPDQRGREQVFLSLDNKTLVQVQRCLAESQDAEWRQFLVNASVDMVAVLTNTWEKGNLEEDFLGVVLGALGDDGEAIQEQLVCKQEKFRQNCAAIVYRSFGQ
ncbi:hypothetical protein PHYBOEH_004941 [Phytophthora boehmeriae]|uniref:JmjC domain-containing protein n=1 Tax=Phytophthora boehmeriae TaxID=109152 RepID=A0A8T1WN41_9STRA|nr:hypothetical protein PHYBOEH_004941 [Phytophthora boehmeriae]